MLYQAVSLTVLAVVTVVPSVLGIQQGLRLAVHRPFIQTILRNPRDVCNSGRELLADYRRIHPPTGFGRVDAPTELDLALCRVLAAGIFGRYRRRAVPDPYRVACFRLGHSGGLARLSLRPRL
jgi:hypothetical protein